MYQRRLIPAGRNSLGVTAITIDALFLAIAAIALGIRVKSRSIQGVRLNLNDYAALLAWPLTAGLVTTAVLAVIGGAGRHAIDVDPGNIPDILKGYVAADIAWAAANTSIKISIVHFYLTIFGPNKSFRKITYVVMALVVSFGVGVIVMALTICQPLAKNWNPLLPGHCGSTIDAVLATSIINMMIDLIIIVLPMPMIWRLQMATRRQIALTITFGLGLIVCVITILRIIIAARVNVSDFTYDLAKLAIVTDLEPILGMSIACLPLFPPTFKRMRCGHRDDPTPRNALSSSLARLRTKSSKNSAFRRFDDSYPLTDVEGSRTQNHITSSDSKPRSSFEDGGLDVGTQVYPGSTIKVKQGWEVRSDKAM